MPTVPLPDGLVVRWIEEGAGDRVPLVLLHGGLMTGAANWSGHLPLLAVDRRVIAPDARGHGATVDGSDAPFSYARFADDAVLLVRSLGLGRAALAGWSDGANVAIEAAIRHPDAVAAVVAFAADLRRDSEHWRQGVRRVFGFDPRKPWPSIEEWAAKRSRLADLARDLHDPAHGDGYWRRHVARAMGMWTTDPGLTRERLATISAPTLVTTGDRDEFVPVEDAVAMWRAIPGAELEVVPGWSHAGVLAEPDRFAASVRAFLARHGV